MRAPAPRLPAESGGQGGRSAARYVGVHAQISPRSTRRSWPAPGASRSAARRARDGNRRVECRCGHRRHPASSPR